MDAEELLGHLWVRLCPQHQAPSHFDLQTLKYLVQSASAYAACLPVALASPGAAGRCA